jgi:uncharacterized protein
VAYYVMGAERWRYTDDLEAITVEHRPLYLDSTAGASRVFASGALGKEIGTGSEDIYVYDPRDTSIAELEAASKDLLSLRPTFRTDNVRDQTLVFANDGKHLVYHSGPFACDTEISGFFKLIAWLAIDQPDTDVGVSVFEIGRDGGSILLSTDWSRARYRVSLRESQLIRTKEPLRYDFERFTFVSRQIRAGSVLRLVIGPLHSIYFEKNYNSGGTVSEESMNDARPVAVKLFHNATRPSALYVPFGRPEE